MVRTLIAGLLLALAVAPANAGDLPLPAPVTDAMYPTRDMARVRLGQMLFYDPILSGNRNISCATCHHPRFATADGVALSIGEGGIGLGPQRRADPDNPPEHLIPRNAPALFNLGVADFTVLFHDGRIEVDPARPSGLRTPLDDEMVMGFSGILSAQTMFPVLSPDEMAGQYGENEISRAVRMGLITGPNGAWDLLARRVAAIPAYRDAFVAIPDIGTPPGFTDISDVIADFIAAEWRSDTSPFDAYLRGEKALDADQMRGMTLFYGKARCATCHSGPFQTDHAFHAMAVPQFGPGKAAPFESHQRDDGRFRVTGKEADRYAFRTPSLRNVTRTMPYGHSGAFADLRAFLRHHIDPDAGIDWPATLILPAVAPVANMSEARDPARVDTIRDARTVTLPGLSETEINDLLAFLGALEDPVALTGRLGIPPRVPSGLPIDR